MENQINIDDQNAQQIGQNPVNQPTQIPEKSRTNYLVIGLVVLICFAVFGLGGYYLGKQTQNTTTNNNNLLSTPIAKISPTTTELPTATPSTQPSATLPVGWSYKSDACGVRFAIPPKDAPYYYRAVLNVVDPSVPSTAEAGRFWDFPRGGSYPHLLSKLIKGNEEYKQAATIYASETEASGYISSAVVVSCIRNTGAVDNQKMLGLLNSGIQKYNLENNTERMEASKYTIQSTKEISRWNKKVVDIIASEYFPNSGGQPLTNSVEYTMLATPQYIYEVKVFGATNTPFVKETAKKIFDNLIFD